MIKLNLKTNWHAFAFFFAFSSIASSQTSKIFYKDDQGRLNYVSDNESNRITDFSFAGYKAGEANIPSFPVEITISPISGDNTTYIQQAMDQIEVMPLINGILGAVLLQGGAVLRGQGNVTNRASNSIIFSPKISTLIGTNVFSIIGENSSRFIAVDDNIQYGI